MALTKVSLIADGAVKNAHIGETIAVNKGGTGATTEADARTALGLAIGSDVQAQSATLTTLASATAAGLALMDDANAAAQRATLGLVIDTDVTSKSYVDNNIQGIKTKVVRVASAAALPAYTFDVGVITADANGALTVDGVAPSVNNFVLLTDEADPNDKYNGIWRVTATGDESNPFTLERANVADVASEFPGQLVFVNEGTANGGARFLCSTPPATLNVNPVSYTQLSDPATEYTAGDGLDVLANEFSVVVADFASDDLEDDGSNNLRIAAAAAGAGLTGGGGSALAVDLFTPQTFTGDGVETGFTLATTILAGSEVIDIDGALQREGAGEAYTISGTTLTTTAAVPNTAKMTVRGLKP